MVLIGASKKASQYHHATTYEQQDVLLRICKERKSFESFLRRNEERYKLKINFSVEPLQY